MKQLIEPLEKIIKSDLMLLPKAGISQNLKVGLGKFKKTQMDICHLGIDQGSLEFGYTPGKVLGGSPLTQIQTFSEHGLTLLCLKSGEFYAIYHDSKSLPMDISYQHVPITEYLARFKELCGE